MSCSTHGDAGDKCKNNSSLCFGGAEQDDHLCCGIAQTKFILTKKENQEVPILLLDLSWSVADWTARRETEGIELLLMLQCGQLQVEC